MCVLCVLLGSTSQRIFNFSSQNLDNCRVFSMISLQFSFINIFLSFKGVYTISLQLLRDLRERKKERKRERVCFERLESHKFIGIFWCDFDLVFSECMFCNYLYYFISNYLYFRLHYTLQQWMGMLSVCSHFWMEELMWMPKMWDERERWNIESVSELGEERERLWDWQGSVY